MVPIRQPVKEQLGVPTSIRLKRRIQASLSATSSSYLTSFAMSKATEEVTVWAEDRRHFESPWRG